MSNDVCRAAEESRSGGQQEDQEEHRRPRLHVAPAPGTEEGRPAPPRTLREANQALAERRGRSQAVPPAAVTAGGTRASRLTPRQRIDLLLDDGSFVELGALARHRATGFGMEDRRTDTDGVVTGWGTVDGRQVFVHAHDARVFGGSLGEVFAAKVRRVMDLAEAAGAPIVGLNDGGGARIQEGIRSLAGFGSIFAGNVRSSGRIPKISVILGPC